MVSLPSDMVPLPSGTDGFFSTGPEPGRPVSPHLYFPGSSTSNPATPGQLTPTRWTNYCPCGHGPACQRWRNLAEHALTYPLLPSLPSHRTLNLPEGRKEGCLTTYPPFCQFFSLLHGTCLEVDWPPHSHPRQSYATTRTFPSQLLLLDKEGYLQPSTSHLLT